MRCAPNRTKYIAKSYRGVLLRDLLTRAHLRVTEKHETNRAYIVARAADGYVALFSWHEIFNTEVGDHVLVYYERDGLPLTEDSGLIALISDSDQLNCARHVKWLSSVKVAKIPLGALP